MDSLAWLAVYTAAWLAVTAVARGRHGRVEVTPLAILYRLPVTLEPAGGRLRALRRAGYASVAAAFALMALFYYLMVAQFWARYVARLPGAQGGGVVPLIPGVTVPLSVLPHFLVALGVAAAVHELAHAIQARAEGLRVRSAGIALFIFIPAAFVELDEEELKRAPLASRLRVYSAGVAANILLFLALSALAAGLPCSSLSGGVRVVGVEQGSPAQLAGIESGDVIVAVNGQPVHCIPELSDALERAGVKSPQPATLNVTVIRGGEALTLVIHKPANRTTIGVTIVGSFNAAGILLYSSTMLNFALALINAAPLFITDGGKMLTESLDALLGGRGRLAATGLQAATVLLVVSLITIRPILPG
ncbi:MAG: M50 family metallopeptidase [Desulfurococcales archaeon]|nr:M50 family metallopeptidase [Desulfurococcales archaeon]